MIEFTSIKWINRLILILVFLLHISLLVNGFDSYQNISIGTKSLPTEGNFTFIFKLVENETLYFNLINKSSELNFEFPNQYYLNNTDTYNFTINWNIDETIFVENITLNSGFILTNSLNSNNYTIGIDYMIFKEEDKVLEINGSSSLVLRDGMYIKEITVDKLPENNNLIFLISGNPSEEFKVTGCGKFFICNNQTFSLSENGLFELKLNYLIPISTAIGEYNESFNISSVTSNSTINVQFNIDFPNILLKPLELGEQCYQANMPLQVQLECENEFRTYQVEVIRALQSYLSSVNTDIICENLVRTEYVVGDVISELVLESNLELMDDNKNLREDNTYLNSELSSCNDDKSSLKTQINQTILLKDEEIVDLKDIESQKRIDIFKATEIDKDKERNETLFVMKLFCLIVFILCLGLLGYKIFMETMFLKDIKINVIIVGAIGLFFFFSWLGLFIWG